jgi:hypothetical protein
MALRVEGAEKAFEWKDFSKPFETRLAGIAPGQPAAVVVNLPALAAHHSHVNLTVSTSTSGKAWSYNLMVDLSVNGHRLPAFANGPGYTLPIPAGILLPGINTLRFESTAMDSSITYDVHRLQLEFPAGTAAMPAPTPAIEKKPGEKTFSHPLQPKPQEPAPSAVATLPATRPKDAGPPTEPAGEDSAPPVPVVQPSYDPGQRWAVVVGISNYSDSRIPGLRYAARDAHAFYNWIVSPDGGRYAPSKVKLLLDQNATNDKIKDALFNWLKQAIEEDLVVIYFAGHGSAESPDATENLYLLPYNARYDNIAVTGFPMWDIETALRRFIRARRVVIIADACHAAGVGQAFDVAVRAERGITISQINSSLQNLSDINEGVCVISASRDKEYSQEGREWGGGHGVFSHFLIEGLKGAADFDHSGSVSIGEVSVYVSQQVRRATRNAQNPVVAGKFDPSLCIGK